MHKNVYRCAQVAFRPSHWILCKSGGTCGTRIQSQILGCHLSCPGKHARSGAGPFGRFQPLHYPPVNQEFAMETNFPQLPHCFHSYHVIFVKRMILTMDDFLHNYQRRKPSFGTLDHVSCSNYKDVHGDLRAAIQNWTGPWWPRLHG